MEHDFAGTLGARDFSSAVSGFCQDVASAYGQGCVGLRPTPKIPVVREKSLWYPGYFAGRFSGKFPGATEGLKMY